jgi:hypothetical protein
MSGILNLPMLQSHLDGLHPAGCFELSITDSERLFGHNDVAAGRIANFARGHHCEVIVSATGLTFRKNGTLPDL